MQRHIVIVGAGFCGLYTAYLLREKYRVTLLEARERAGGRILTRNGHDLGPSWVWPHHRAMLALVRASGLELFPQYSEGEALYETPQGVQRFVPPPSLPAARVKGGVGSLVDTLVSRLHDVEQHYEEKVTHIKQEAEGLSVVTGKGTYRANHVIVAAAPRVATRIGYVPPLRSMTESTLNAIPTWMGHARKYVVTYARPFWRAAGLSGFVFSHSGPLAEIHDVSTEEEGALFGFVRQGADAQKIEEEVIAQLVRLFGEEARHVTKIYDGHWRQDPLSSTPEDAALQAHPQYGHETEAYDGRLHFVSTEASRVEGGYLEGALLAAQGLARRLWYCERE